MPICWAKAGTVSTRKGLGSPRQPIRQGAGHRVREHVGKRAVVPTCTVGTTVEASPKAIAQNTIVKEDGFSVVRLVCQRNQQGLGRLACLGAFIFEYAVVPVRPGDRAGSMNLIAGGCYLPLQLLNRPQYPLPHRVAVQVALIEHGAGVHGGMYRRVLAVLLREDIGGAVDVDIGDHGFSHVVMTKVFEAKFLKRVSPVRRPCCRS